MDASCFGVSPIDEDAVDAVNDINSKFTTLRLNEILGQHCRTGRCAAVIRFDGGASGMVTWSQVTHGRLNDLSIEVDGTKAALSWRQEEPNQLFVRSLGKATRIFERDPNAEYSSPDAIAACRLPGGHPEAFFEAFANVYRDAFADMRRARDGEEFDSRHSLYPSVYDGLEGVRFMTRCIESHQQDSTWQTWQV